MNLKIIYIYVREDKTKKWVLKAYTMLYRTCKTAKSHYCCEHKLDKNLVMTRFHKN